MQQQLDGSLSMDSAAVSFCPSFNSYASDELVNIAVKVSEEFQEEESKSKSKDVFEEEEDEEDEEEYVDEDEFEFVSTITDLDSRLFFNGEIRQVFPVFNRSLLLNEDCDDRDRGNGGRHVAAALEKLFIDDHDDYDRQASSSSSSDEDEPEPNMNVTFCIWSPKRNNNPISSPSPSPSQSPSRCKKSNSTGSSSSSTPSKKWFKLRDLLKRSNSDGKDSFVFLNKPKNNNNKNSNNNVDSSKEKKVKSGKAKANAKAKAKAKASAASAHEAFYVKNRAIKEGDKKKSYLPYRQDLLGGFPNYNGLGKTLPPSF